MSKKTEHVLLLIDRTDKGHVARIYTPPNAARRDWEFGDETYVEVLATVLGSMSSDGFGLTAIDPNPDGTIYVLTR